MILALQTGTPAREGQASPRSSQAEQTQRERALLCSSCGRPITTPKARIEVSGAHAHTFCNPHGLVYQVGVFDDAPGAGATGPDEHFFSWFPGYAWRVAHCRGCMVHVGWCYGDGDFWGLILDRLTESSDDAER